MNAISSELPLAHLTALRVARVLEQVFRTYAGGFGIRLWDGTTIALGPEKPVATVVVHTAALLRALAWQPDPLRLAEAYFFGEIDVEGDLYALLEQRAHLQSLTMLRRDRLALFSALIFSRGNSAPARQHNAPVRWAKSLPSPASHKHSQANDRKAIAFHYDVSNEFYRLWLDEQMVYSCAYFNEPRESLDQAQRNKLDHICRKLRLKAGERFLDVGCGWGALICWAAKHYGVRAHGITLSSHQYEYTQAKIRDLGMAKQVTV